VILNGMRVPVAVWQYFTSLYSTERGMTVRRYLPISAVVVLVDVE